MMSLKNCLVFALSAAAAAAFVSASAQTQVEGVVQPAVPASKSAVHAVPSLPPASAAQPAQKPPDQPAQLPAGKAAEKPAHKLVSRRVHRPVYHAAPQPAVQALPPLLPESTSQAAEQPAPMPQPYAQPAPQPVAEPAPTPPYTQAAPTPQPDTQSSPQSYAQPAPQTHAQATGQPVVDWTLQVIRDGQQIDSFNGAATVGEARTNRHHRVVTHDVGCMGQPAGSIDLQRTITVSPLRADPAGSVLAIDSRETLESDTTAETPGGCKLPPQPSQVHASHPGLIVPAGQWVNWQIVGQDPSLLYRVRASLASP